jgi:hypothetical protein
MRCGSSKRLQEITEPPGAATQKTWFLKNHAMETSNHWCSCCSEYIYWRLLQFLFIRSPGIGEIPAELIKVERFAMRSVNLLLPFGIRSNCLRSGRSWSFYLHTRRVIKHIIVIIKAYHFCQLRKHFIQHYAFKVNFICRGNYWGSSR